MTNDKQRERLVELLKKKYDHFCDQCGVNKDSHYTDNLTDYLLANGVIVPPCKVGDNVYWLDNGKIKSDEVFEISIHSDGILVHTGIQFCLEQVFLTKEEAEKALNNVQNGNSCEGGAE